MSQRPLAAVVLAAGQGKRMRAPVPKVLIEACGLPLVEQNIAWSLSSFQVRGERTEDNRADAAEIEEIILDDNIWMPISWLGSRWLFQL